MYYNSKIVHFLKYLILHTEGKSSEMSNYKDYNYTRIMMVLNGYAKSSEDIEKYYFSDTVYYIMKKCTVYG